MPVRYAGTPDTLCVVSVFVCGGIGRQRQSFGQRIGRIEQEGLRRRLPSQSAQQFTVLIRILGPGIPQTFLAESVGFYLFNSVKGRSPKRCGIRRAKRRYCRCHCSCRRWSSCRPGRTIRHGAATDRIRATGTARYPPRSRQNGNIPAIRAMKFRIAGIGYALKISSVLMSHRFSPPSAPRRAAQGHNAHFGR